MEYTVRANQNQKMSSASRLWLFESKSAVGRFRPQPPGKFVATPRIAVENFWKQFGLLRFSVLAIYAGSVLWVRTADAQPFAAGATSLTGRGLSSNVGPHEYDVRAENSGMQNVGSLTVTKVRCRMSGIASRLTVLRDMRRKHVTQLRLNQSDAGKDKDGSASNSLMGTLRFLAVADYVSGQGVTTFKGNLSEAASLRASLFDRFDSGESISPSYVSMLSYKALLNALAAGNEQLAVSLASRMGGRAAIEQEYDQLFDVAFGYALKGIVLSDFASSSPWVDALDGECKAASNSDFSGYAKVLRAVLTASQADADAGLKEIVAGHQRQCAGKGLFKETEDELLCVWGVAVANLARMRGLQVGSVEPLIPSDLLI